MMKRIVLGLAALAAFQAAAITATKEYVDRKDTEIRTNTYTKAETDARIAELAPRTSLEPATNYANEAVAALSNAVPGMVTALGGWQWESSNGYVPCGGPGTLPAQNDGKVYVLYESGPIWNHPDAPENTWGAFITIYQWDDLYDEVGGWGPNSIIFPDTDPVSGSATDDVVTFECSMSSKYGTFTARRQNALGLARMSDVAPTVSNTVTKAYVENLGIESGIQEETDPVWAGDRPNYATKQSVSVVSNLAAAADTKANMAIDAVANADTSYPRYTTVTNLNQSVQYVSITDPSPSTLSILFPTNGVTKDWIVYVTSVTNVSLVLPSATYWMADTAYTNDIAPAKPTAFYFSQIATNIFYLGRQELTEVAP